MSSGILAAWREVKAVVVGLVGLILLALLVQKRGLALLTGILLGWVFYFFRDPERTAPLGSADVILAPADGRITAIEPVDEPLFIQGYSWRVSIFLSLFDVHIQRSPYAGVVQYIRYQHGDFAPAFLRDTHSNEANFIGFNTVHGPVGVKQIAGILARRIVCWVKPGDKVTIRERLGLIKFGSRVDLFLPLSVEIVARVGQQVYGGQTVVARWPEDSLK